MIGIHRKPLTREEALKKYKIKLPEGTTDADSFVKSLFYGNEIEKGKLIGYFLDISEERTVPRFLLDLSNQYAGTIMRIQSLLL